MPEKEDNIATAVAVMTAWAGDPSNEDPGFLLNTAWQYVNGPEAEIPLMLGMISLAGILLIKLEKATGETANETLQALALKYGPA